MKTDCYTKRIWFLNALVAAASLAMTSCGKGSASSATLSPSEMGALAASPDVYQHFLYLRHDLEEGGAVTDSLVLVRVDPDGFGFEARPVYSRKNLNIGWHPLGVRNGKLYGIKIGVLIAVDLHTGTAEEVDSGIQSWKWCDGKLYAFVRQAPSHQASLLRVYDAETESYRDIGIPPYPPEGIYWQGWPPQIQVAPDHHWLANFCRSTNFMQSYMHQLRLIAVDDGSVKISKISVAAREFVGGGDIGSESRPPFCWVDSRTLLVVRDVSTNRFSMFFQKPDEGIADMILSRVDIDEDRITDICPLPRFRPNPGEPFFRIRKEGEVPHLVIGRLGQYRVDLVERRLVRDANIGGHYTYTQGSADDHADVLRFEGELLENEMAIPEVAASPDGRRVAWHARLVHRPMSDVGASEIRFHDALSGATRTVAREWIPGAFEYGRLSFERNLFWISTNNLAPRSQTNAPAGWTPFSRKPYLTRG